jgi:hypothetical protein
VNNSIPLDKVSLGPKDINGKDYRYYTYAVKLRDSGENYCKDSINQEARGVHDIVGGGFNWYGKPNLITEQ